MAALTFSCLFRELTSATNKIYVPFFKKKKKKGVLPTNPPPPHSAILETFNFWQGADLARSPKGACFAFRTNSFVGLISPCLRGAYWRFLATSVDCIIGGS